MLLVTAFFPADCCCMPPTPAPLYRASTTFTVCCCKRQQVPSTLSRNVINSVRDRALSILATRAALSSVRNTYASITSVNAASSFVHPAGLSGPAELATLRFRVANPNFRSPQLGAFSVLLSGEGVPPKTYPGGWAPPTNCPAEGYAGPLAMSKVQVLYGGREADSANCPANFPAGAPRDICGHISFVEMDGQVRASMELMVVTSKGK
eukprot:GHRQ01021075.1.p1 GENE.GHRQ01021075.1~~GHRQ01021075.1.p1  ORF type:complete len:208 (-),score=36.24 GHRQ01021075.1:531-1154(-)